MSADFVTYPLDQGYLSAFTADVWSSSIPLPQLLAMFSPTASQGTAQQVAPVAWRPAKPFPPNKYVAPVVVCAVVLADAFAQVRRGRRAGRPPRHLEAPHGRVSPLPMLQRPGSDCIRLVAPATSRVTVTDYRGNILFDSFVRPTCVPGLSLRLLTVLNGYSIAGSPSAIIGRRRRG